MPGDKGALWLGVIYLAHMQMSFFSPPFGYALFYMRGVTPDSISMVTTFRSALVFLGLQVLGLLLCILLLGIVTYLPGLVYG